MSKCHTPENRSYSELPQDMGTYDPIESEPRCSVKKCGISGEKWAPAASPRPTLQQGQHKNAAYLVSTGHCPVMIVTKNLDHFRKKLILGQKKCIFGPKFCIFYATPMKPLFFGSDSKGIISSPYLEVVLDAFGFR